MKRDPSARSSRGIAADLEARIRAGTLAPGAPLPSVRELAAATAVSPVTAAAALADLRRRGLIVTQERRRSYVSPRPPVSTAPAQAALPAGVRDVANGYPDPELLPDLGRAFARLDGAERTYDDEPTLPELAELARAEFAEAGVGAEHICLASGALDAVDRVLGAHLGPGDRVAVEDPCYSASLDLLRALGLVPVAVPIDDRGLRPKQLTETLSAGVGAVLLTPRAHNPTGAALDEERADELERVLDRHRDVLVIEDDHQGPVAGTPGFNVIRRQERWARVRSVTKALGPDLRVAFITGDETTVSRVEGRLAVGPGWVSGILQRLVVELMSAKSIARTLTRATRLYAERREPFLEALATRGVQASGRSGFNVWVPVPDEAQAVAALLQRGWAVAPGAPFRLDSPPAVRVTTAALAPAEAHVLAHEIAAVLTPTRRRRAA